MVFKDVFLALWFFLPAAIANVTPIFVAHMRSLAQFEAPMDFGKTFRGKRIFGAHKTWRGFISGVIMATFVLWLEQLAVRHFGWAQSFTAQINYATLPTLLMGPLFAVGALGGDAIESFFKRQRGLQPGRGWFPWDQLDYIIGGAIATMPFVPLSIRQYLWLILLWLVVHVVSTYIGWLAHLKESPL